MKGKNDEAMTSIVTIDANGMPQSRLADGGAVLDINFRKDRQIEWNQAVNDPNFKEFNVQPEAKKIKVTGITQYIPQLPEERVVLPDIKVKNGLIEVLANQGINVVYVFDAEKGKFIPAFRGGRTQPYHGRATRFRQNHARAAPARDTPTPRAR